MIVNTYPSKNTPWVVLDNDGVVVYDPILYCRQAPGNKCVCDEPRLRSFVAEVSYDPSLVKSLIEMLARYFAKRVTSGLRRVKKTLAIPRYYELVIRDNEIVSIRGVRRTDGGGFEPTKWCDVCTYWDDVRVFALLVDTLSQYTKPLEELLKEVRCRG